MLGICYRFPCLDEYVIGGETAGVGWLGRRSSIRVAENAGCKEGDGLSCEVSMHI